MMYLFIQPMFIGTTELILVGGIALLLFGGKKLPEMMKGLGQGVQSFKQGMNEPLSEKPDKDPKVDEKNEDVESNPSTKGDL